MNIFFLSLEPLEAAKMLGNKHVHKMIVESAQMMSTAHRVLTGVQGTVKHKDYRGKTVRRTRWILPDHGEYDGMWASEKCILYWDTHINHPCNQWIRDSGSNYKWLYTHFVGLSEEFEFRYGHEHNTFLNLNDWLESEPASIPENGFTKPPQCMPDEFKHPTTVKAYQAYYKKAKAHLHTYTRRQPPEFLR